VGDCRKAISFGQVDGAWSAMPYGLKDGEEGKIRIRRGDRQHVFVAGSAQSALVKKIYATPKPIVDKVSELIK